jgi:hypothetical protein
MNKLPRWVLGRRELLPSPWNCRNIYKAENPFRDNVENISSSRTPHMYGRTEDTAQMWRVGKLRGQFYLPDDVYSLKWTVCDGALYTRYVDSQVIRRYRDKDNEHTVRRNGWMKITTVR